jgi:leucyl/phenylalanyl-tRNA--protein transferase
VEVFDGARQVGGIYGVAVGRMFFGESMFSAASGGSKVALAGLARILSGWGWPLIDAQVENPHLLSLGARHLPRPEFLAEVAHWSAKPGLPGSWAGRVPPFMASDLAGPAPV